MLQSQNQSTKLRGIGMMSAKDAHVSWKSKELRHKRKNECHSSSECVEKEEKASKKKK